MPTKKSTARTSTAKTLTAQDALLAGEIRWSPPATRGSTASRELPISEAAARRATRWLMAHFGTQIRSAARGTPFGPEILCAIACQETAYFWLPLLESLQTTAEFKNDADGLADLIVARCVLDASGDHPDSPRTAFPKNTAAFRAEFGDAFTGLLSGEANKTRALRGYGPKEWVYKGYGIFQYDLQSVREDPAFFRDLRWHDFAACLEKCLSELKNKYRAQDDDLWEAIRAYNGSGPRARAYRDNVRTFAGWTADEISKLPAPRAIVAATTRSGEMPAAKPRMTREKLAARLAAHGIDRTLHPLLVVGIRGYYLDTMGKPGVNDRGMYDDAIFLDSPDVFAAYNGNTDPSRYKSGHGTAANKGMATLKAGVWHAYQFDTHGGSIPHFAICQRRGPVVVIRDGTPPYEDEGNHGINIHRGSYHGTSSLGCQTLHPDQWPSFIALAEDIARRHFGTEWKRTTIPYVLLED